MLVFIKSFLFFLTFTFFVKDINATTLFGPNDFDITSQIKVAGSFKIFKPSRVYEDLVYVDPEDELKHYKYDYGFGGSINYLYFEYSDLFGHGQRYMLYHTFANSYPVNPYLGINYIRKTGFEDEDMERDLDGFDLLIGMEVSYFKYVKPYVEYIYLSGLWFFGVRFNLEVVFSKE